jgi:hypothetical protein
MDRDDGAMMPYHVEAMRHELWTLEPWRKFWGPEATQYEYDGYAVLVAHPQLGLAWLHMTNESVARLLWPS